MNSFSIPSTITIERFELTSGSQKLITYDHWKITAVDLSPPTEDQFRIEYDDNARVEFRANGKRTMSYRYKKGRDTEYMLNHRRYNASLADRSDHNCATAAIAYAILSLNKQMTSSDYEGLVSGPDKETSLYKLQQLAQKKQLHTLAVTSDIEELANLENCQVILHLPQAKHTPPTTSPSTP